MYERMQCIPYYIFKHFSNVRMSIISHNRYLRIFYWNFLLIGYLLTNAKVVEILLVFNYFKYSKTRDDYNNQTANYFTNLMTLFAFAELKWKFYFFHRCWWTPKFCLRGRSAKTKCFYLLRCCGQSWAVFSDVPEQPHLLCCVFLPCNLKELWTFPSWILATRRPDDKSEEIRKQRIVFWETW